MSIETSTQRLQLLEPQVRSVIESDQAFAEAFFADPIGATRARFGDAAMPNEGEYVKTDGGVPVLVFPQSGLSWPLVSTELSDDLLDAVSGGAFSDPSSRNSTK